MLGYSPSRSPRDDSISYKESLTPASHNPLDLVPISRKKSRGYEFNPHDENPRLQKSRAEAMTFPGSNKRESLESSGSSSSYASRHREVRFDDQVYLDTYPRDRFPGAVKRQRETDGAGPRDSLVRDPGSGNMNGDLLCRGGHRNTLPKKSRANERQRSYVPAAPIIPRLPTPDFDSTSHHELGLAKYDFCPCCTSYDEMKEGDVRCKKGKSKMHKQGMTFFFVSFSEGGLTECS